MGKFDALHLYRKQNSLYYVNSLSSDKYVSGACKRISRMQTVFNKNFYNLFLIGEETERDRDGKTERERKCKIQKEKTNYCSPENVFNKPVEMKITLINLIVISDLLIIRITDICERPYNF